MQALLDRFHVGVDDVPVDHLPRRPRAARTRPSRAGGRGWASAPTSTRRQVRDVVIVGAGPAGLAAAVYAASEGLDVAGAREHGARRAGGHQLAHRELPRLPHRHLRPGAGGARARPRPRSSAPRSRSAARVVRLDCDSRPYRLVSRRRPGGAHAHDRHRHRRAVPEARRCRRWRASRARASTTAPPHLERRSCCEGEEVAVVGGGNSAGQAAVFLSRLASHVHMLVRGPGLADSMSRYLIQRIESTPNITLRTRTAGRGAGGRRPPRAACAGGTSTRGEQRDARRSGTCS